MVGQGSWETCSATSSQGTQDPMNPGQEKNGSPASNVGGFLPWELPRLVPNGTEEQRWIDCVQVVIATVVTTTVSLRHGSLAWENVLRTICEEPCRIRRRAKRRGSTRPEVQNPAGVQVDVYLYAE